MAPVRAPHSPAMLHRTFLGLAVSTCLVACLGKTTSLGGPEGSSNGEDGDAGAGQALSRSPSFGGFDGGSSSSSSGFGRICHGYSWNPVPSSVACQYLLPSGTPPGDDPRLDPRFWNPDNVNVEIFIPQHQRQGSYDRRLGSYTATPDACGSSDGWYYVVPADRQPLTLFALCPTSCASIADDGVLLRLAADTYCEDIPAP